MESVRWIGANILAIHERNIEKYPFISKDKNIKDLDYIVN